jgi:voltage-gated potassium channel
MTKRSLWYNYLNEPSTNNFWSMVVTIFLSVAIVLNIVEVVLGSVAEFAVYMEDWILLASYIFATIFSLEYVARVWVAAESPHEKHLGVVQKRWLYIRSSMGLIDLFSFLPIILWIILPIDIFGDLRILKLISVVRILKLTRYSASLLMLARVYRENKNTLLAAGLVMMILMFIAATGIFIFERFDQPDAFGSIPASMWWAFVTLTTVGYGDITPITIGGKIFGSMVMVCGVGVAAMPAGIFASSFVQLVREQEHEKRLKNNKRKRQVQASKVSSGSVNGDLQGLDMSPSEQREVSYMMDEYDLSLKQAVGVVSHYRH